MGRCCVVCFVLLVIVVVVAVRYLLFVWMVDGVMWFSMFWVLG